jgi:hypothetical protein
MNGLFSHKKNEILSFVVTWMELKVIMLNETSQTQKDKYHVFSVICGNQYVSLIEGQNGIVFTKTGKDERKEDRISGTKNTELKKHS